MKDADEERLVELAHDTQYVSALLCDGQDLEPAVREAKIQSAELLRHKPGKRCLIKYQGIAASGSTIEFLGKMRFKGLDEKSAAIQRTLASLQRKGADCSYAQPVAVPFVYGTLPSLNMWLQELVAGEGLSVRSADFVASQPKVAEALARLHQTRLTKLKQHTVDHELELLQRRFQQLRQTHPELASYVDRLDVKVAGVATALRSSSLLTTIHRDFYFDQFLLTESDAVLVDLDLCCLGPPELDIGNYIGHLKEYAIRFPDATITCRAAEESFTQAYFECLPQSSRVFAELWTVLTLARHVSLSTTLPGRSHTTLALAEATLNS